MHISIIVVTYNSKKETDDCIASLSIIKSKDLKWNALVVDNGSVEQYSLPAGIDTSHFEVLRSEANLGFTGGNNLGIYNAIERHNSEYVLLLNNDTTVDATFLTNLVKCSLETPEHGVVCPKIYFYPGDEYHDSYSRSDRGNVLWYAGGSIDWTSLSAFHRGVDEIDRGHFDALQTTDFATGCCMLIKREALEKVGMFDKRYFLYFEDVDLSARIKDAGYTLGFCSSSHIWHKNAKSSGGSGSQIHNYYIARNRLLFSFQHGSLRNKLLALRVWVTYILSASSLEQQAAIDFALRRFGKQPVVLSVE